jgi:hypothetical protein
MRESEMEFESRVKRVCDAAEARYQIVLEDGGVEALSTFFKSDITAFTILAAKAMGNRRIGIEITRLVCNTMLDNLARDL